jgi:hypothetical protein
MAAGGGYDFLARAQCCGYFPDSIIARQPVDVGDRAKTPDEASVQSQSILGDSDCIYSHLGLGASGLGATGEGGRGSCRRIYDRAHPATALRTRHAILPAVVACV